MSNVDEPDEDLVRLLVRVGQAKRVLLALAAALSAVILFVSVVAFTDPRSPYRSIPGTGFWNTTLGVTQAMGIWLLTSAVLMVGWVLLTVAELWVAIRSISEDDDGVTETFRPDEPSADPPAGDR